MHNFFIFQPYVCYTMLLNKFRAARCSSSGGQIVYTSMLHYAPQHVSSSTPLILRRTNCTEGDDTRGCGDTIGPPEDEQHAARNMLRSIV